MQTLARAAELRAAIQSWRAAGERVGFVPTMGNLHDGHLDLVHSARAAADRLVVSIFVNPLQFGANEDLDNYPRTPDADAERLAAAGVDLLFLPAVAEMYPLPLAEQTAVEVPGLSDLHCGASRPGHFRGVTTVVSKLFNLVQPDDAFFGAKDFQQVVIIEHMVRDLCMPVAIHRVPTRREADGLAMSSRNGYLSAGERARAPALYRELQRIREQILAGDQAFAALCEAAFERLSEAGLAPEYVRVCRQADLQDATAGDKSLVILAAARLGKTRLIDNVTV